MTEPSIRELLTRAVETGPPPGIQVSVDDVLARNARVLRRRRIGQVAAAVVLLAGTAGLSALIPGQPPSALPAPPAAPPPTTEGRPPTGPPPTGPPPDYQARAQALLDRLVAAVPDGYTLPDEQDSTPGPGDSSYALRTTSWRNPAKPVNELYSAVLEVRFDGRAAALSAKVSDRIPSTFLRSGDLCATRVNPEEQDCRVVTATNGTPVRIGSWHPVTGSVDEATYFADGVLVTVQQGGRPRPGVYALGRPVLPDRRLADLTTDPALRP